MDNSSARRIYRQLEDTHLGIFEVSAVKQRMIKFSSGMVGAVERIAPHLANFMSQR